MNKLTDLFVKTVGQRTTELGTEIFQLKQRLQKTYPQLNQRDCKPITFK